MVRADLWAFASAVAVEWGIDRNNKASGYFITSYTIIYFHTSYSQGCDGEDSWGDVERGCLHLRASEPDCKIEGREGI